MKRGELRIPFGELARVKISQKTLKVQKSE